MSKRHLGGVILAASLALPSQSPLTTSFAGSTSLFGPTAVQFFDLTVNVPITIIGIDVNTTSVANTTGTLAVYSTASTYVGNDINPGAWTLRASGPVTSAGLNMPSSCTLTPMSLAPGNHGIAVQFSTITACYSLGNGTSVPGSGTNQTFSTAELTLRAGASANNVLGTAICCQPRVINCSLHYSVGGGGGTVATRTNYGTGCVSAADSCFDENFTTSAAFDLSNSAMSLVHTGVGYIARSGLSTFVTPTGAAVSLPLTDDSETTVALSAPLKYGRAGSTLALTVCSNGYVSVATGNGTSSTPSVATFLNAPRTGWWCWHDYDPASAGSGQVKFEEIGGIAYVTWDGVWDYLGTTIATASTFQMQFELATGTVHFVWQTMSAFGNGRLIGFSEGGASANPGNTDISAVLPATFTAATFAISPLGLTASARPIAGNTIDLDTSNIGPTAPFGAVLLSLTRINPGTSLTGLGMAGCFQYQGGEVTLLFLPSGAPTVSTPFTIPNALGIHIYAQSFAYDPTAGLTVVGAISSNGVDLGIGNL